MIFGIGTDIVSYARFQALHQRHGERAAQHLLSAAEWPRYEASSDPARYLMKRFAAKEAFAKATGRGLRDPVSLRRISVVNDELGKPSLQFDAALGTYLAQLGIIRHHLSISDEQYAAVAFVVLERI